MQLGEHQRPLFGDAQHIGLVLEVEESSVSVQQCITLAPVQRIQMGFQAGDQPGEPLTEEGHAARSVLGRELVTQEKYFCGVGIDLDYLISLFD